jgi:O-antigen/teichoic acid export membrane protein
LVPAVCALGTIALLSRELEPKEFGRFVLAWSLALFWANIGAGWLGQGILRYHTRFENGGTWASYVGFARWARWLSSGIAAAGAGVAGQIAGASLSLVSGAAALAAVEAMLMVAIAASQAKMRPQLVVIIDSAKSALGFLGLASVVVLSPSPSAAAILWAAAAAEALAAAFSLLSLRECAAKPERLSANRAVRAAILRYGIPIGVFSLLGSALTVGDRFLIARWQGVAQAGAYGGVYDAVSRSFGLLLFPVLLGAHPLITKAWNAGDYTGYRQALRTALILEAAAGIPLILVMVAAHQRVVHYVLGKPVERSLELVATIGLAALLWQFAQLVHKPAELSGRLPVLVTGVLLALLVNIGANVWLLPHAPVVVAGYTSALASATYLAFVLWRQRVGDAR